MSSSVFGVKNTKNNLCSIIASIAKIIKLRDMLREQRLLLVSVVVSVLGIILRGIDKHRFTLSGYLVLHERI